MSSATKARAVGVGVGVLVVLALAWVWVNAASFGAGDRLVVVADVGGCGRVYAEAGGERWSSDGDWAVDPSMDEGTTLDGMLVRRSENQADLELDDGGAPIAMERIRSDRFVALGCLAPGAQS